MPKPAPPIAQLFAHLQGLKIPPLQQWQPGRRLEIGLRIAADGQWYHQGRLIARQSMVKLFASLLQCAADGTHCLVTPQVKYPVIVGDAPFQAVELKRQYVGRQQNLIFRTNMDDVVLADREHPIRITMNTDSAQPAPYVEVRDGLQAKICRSVYYELTELLEPASARQTSPPARIEQSGSKHDAEHVMVGVRSAGQFFPFGKY